MKLLSVVSALALGVSPALAGCAHHMDGSMMQGHSMMSGMHQTANANCPPAHATEQIGQSGAQSGMMGGQTSGQSGAMMNGAMMGGQSGAASGQSGAMMNGGMMQGAQANCPPATTATPPSTAPAPTTAPAQAPDDQHQGHHPQ